MTIIPDQFANFAASTIAGGAGGAGTTLGAADTQLILATGDGAKFPSSYTGTFKLLIGSWSGLHEIVHVTARSTDTLTIVRAQEGTVAQSWVPAIPVEAVITKGSMDSLWSNLVTIAATNVYNVLNYGAVGNGSTDDTTAIAAAIAAANSAGGGGVYFPGGHTFISGPQAICANVDYFGDGAAVSIIKLKSGSNADLFSAQTNLIDLSGTGHTNVDGGIAGFTFRHLMLDGNASAQSSGPSWCIRVYGYGYRIESCEIRNGFSGCVQSDWNGPDNAIPTGATGLSIESQWINTKIHGTLGGPILQFGGPHDSQFSNCIIFDGKDQSLDLTGKLTPGLHIGPHAAGVSCTNIHVWNNNLPFLIEAQSTFSNCYADISNRGSNQGVGVFLLSGLVDWTGGMIFGSAGSLSSTGILVGQTAGGTPLTPYMLAQSAGLTTAAGITECRFVTRIHETQVAAINFANDGGRNLWDMTIYLTSGTYYSGTWNVASDTRLMQRGSTVNGDLDFTGNAIFTGTLSLAAAALTVDGSGNLGTSGRIDLTGANGIRFTGTGRADPANDTTVRIIRSITASTLDVVMGASGARFVGNSGASYTPLVTIDNNGLITAVTGALSSTTSGAQHLQFTGAAANPSNAGTTPTIRNSSTGSTLDVIGGTSGFRVIQNNASGYNINLTVDNNGALAATGNVSGARVVATTSTAGTLHFQVTTPTANPANAGTTQGMRGSSTANTLDMISGTSGWRVIQNSAAGGYNPLLTIDNTGNLTGVAGAAFGQSSSAAAIATSGTITTASITVARVNPAGAVTGVIMQSGTIAGQICMVVNEATGANTVTMAASGTSHVADGTSAVISGLRSMVFVWDSGTSLWYRTG